MLLTSQPLDPRITTRWAQKSEDVAETTERNIKSQRIGAMFDDGGKRRRISIKIRFNWKWDDIKGMFFDVKYMFRNHIRWWKTLWALRSWEGFDGLLSVMRTHLLDYIETEEKYGHATEDCKKQKIASAKEAVALLERMKEPQEYITQRRREVEVKYPEYMNLITEYDNGSVSYSGDFVAQGAGWAGIEGGNDPREGYFEFIDGTFTLVSSPDNDETDRLLSEIRQYHAELHAAYQQAEADSDKDFDKLGQLLKDHLYSWWD